MRRDTKWKIKNNNLENYNDQIINIDNEEFVNNDNKQEFQDINYNDAEYTEAEYRELDDRVEFSDSQQPKDSRTDGKLFLIVFAHSPLKNLECLLKHKRQWGQKVLTSSVTANKRR